MGLKLLESCVNRNKNRSFMKGKKINGIKLVLNRSFETFSGTIKLFPTLINSLVQLLHYLFTLVAS